MQALVVVMAVVDILVCVALVFLVVFQEGNDRGLGSIAGGADTYLGKKKGSSIDAKLKKLTAVLAIAFAILSIALYLLTGRAIH